MEKMMNIYEYYVTVSVAMKAFYLMVDGVLRKSMTSGDGVSDQFVQPIAE